MKKLVITSTLAVAAVIGAFAGKHNAKSEEHVFAAGRFTEVSIIAAVNNRFVGVRSGGRSLRATATRLRAGERFRMCSLIPGRVNFVGRTGFVTCDGIRLRANRNSAGANEDFVLVTAARTVGIRANNGRFVSSERGRRNMRCNRRNINRAEQFIVGPTTGVIPL